MSFVRPEVWRPKGVDDLEPQAWHALRDVSRSVLVTAGAGAGKTEFMAQKAAYLLETDLCPPPERILSISFKRDAARNLGDRVNGRCLPELARRFSSFTFDAFTKSLVDRFRMTIPEEYRPSPNYEIVFGNTQHYDEFLQTYGFNGVSARDFQEALTAEVLPIDASASTVNQALMKYWQVHVQHREVPALSFAMVNRLAQLLVQTNPQILRGLRLTYPFVFLDEFQDTTVAQFQLLRTIFEGSKSVLTAVGDDKQRIMLWAGAMPDAFAQFEEHFSARRHSLVFNWRAHADLVRIQHAIASQIDASATEPQAQADRTTDGDIAAIWQFVDEADEQDCMARWIENEVMEKVIQPHDLAILVRARADQVEWQLSSPFEARNLRIRNLARIVEGISIQDLLSEEMTQILLRLLRLGATTRSPADWTASSRDLQFLHGVDPRDEDGVWRLQQRLQSFVREMRVYLNTMEPTPDSAEPSAKATLDFLGRETLGRAFPSYQRESDFARVWKGFVALLGECLQHADSWRGAIDEFEGVGQIALMTIHKSKGLEFHTMIFHGLDNQTWWSLTPDRAEELNAFFVAFTRARQRAFFTLCQERGQAVDWVEEMLASADVSQVDLCGSLE